MAARLKRAPFNRPPLRRRGNWQSRSAKSTKSWHACFSGAAPTRAVAHRRPTLFPMQASGRDAGPSHFVEHRPIDRGCNFRSSRRRNNQGAVFTCSTPRHRAPARGGSLAHPSASPLASASSSFKARVRAGKTQGAASPYCQTVTRRSSQGAAFLKHPRAILETPGGSADLPVDLKDCIRPRLRRRSSEPEPLPAWRRWASGALAGADFGDRKPDPQAKAGDKTLCCALFGACSARAA